MTLKGNKLAQASQEFKHHFLQKVYIEIKGLRNLNLIILTCNEDWHGPIDRLFGSSTP